MPATAKAAIHRKLSSISGPMTGNSQARAKPRARTITTYSGINRTAMRARMPSQRKKGFPWTSGRGTTVSTVSSAGLARLTRTPRPNTINAPRARRRPAQFQPRTNPMKTKVAGFSTVLPSQKAMAAPGVARSRRRPITTGAAQQVHIMPGSAIRPAAKTAPIPRRPSSRAIRPAGSSAWIAEPSSSPSTIACQIAFP